MPQTAAMHSRSGLDLFAARPGYTLHLADMGADVIKIEDTKEGDYARKLGTVKKQSSEMFLAINRNRRNLRLDLRQQTGKEVFLRLAKTANVIVEGFRPDVVDD